MKKFEKINLGLKEVYEELFMNEMYAKDISKKIRSAQRIKGNSGKPPFTAAIRVYEASR